MNTLVAIKDDAQQPRAMKRARVALMVALCPLVAQAAEPVVPSAGTILREVQPALRSAPASTGTGLTIEHEGSELPSSAPFLVKSIQITGNTLFDTPTLHALVADAEGNNLTLVQLNERVTRITDYYRSRGYSLARAMIPAQRLQGGMVRIEVIEARFGKVTFDNDGRVNDRLLEATLSPLQGGQPIDQAALDHSLLLLSDLPGVAVNAVLRPGEAVGTSDLLVNIPSAAAIDGNLVLDNYGNGYTGEAHIGATMNLNNPLHHGDVLSASALSSGGGLNYGSLAYDSVLNGRGARAGGSYSALHYRLGGSLDPLDAHGTAQVASLWAMHPFVRSRHVNLYGLIQYDRLQLRDHIDAAAIRTDRHLGNARASLSADVRDELLWGAVSSWNVSWTRGRVGFDDQAAQSVDAATAKTQGEFSKWNVSLSRLQGLSPTNTLYLAVSGQWSNDNLDAAEKTIAGGPLTVRGYDMGALSGDSGYLGTVELRHDLLFAWALQSRFQVVAFVDSARVTINETAWVAGANSATLSGAGVGLNWAGSNQWGARFYVATRPNSPAELMASHASTRAWAQISKVF